MLRSNKKRLAIVINTKVWCTIYIPCIKDQFSQICPVLDFMEFLTIQNSANVPVQNECNLHFSTVTEVQCGCTPLDRCHLDRCKCDRLWREGRGNDSHHCSTNKDLNLYKQHCHLKPPYVCSGSDTDYKSCEPPKTPGYVMFYDVVLWHHIEAQLQVLI